MRYIIVDTETVPFSPGNMAPKIVCMSMSDGKHSKVITDLCSPSIKEVIKELLLDDEVTIVGHSVSYDTACFISNYPELTELVVNKYENNLIQDTQVKERLMDIFIGKISDYGLADLCKQKFNIFLEKTEWRTSYDALLDIPIELWPIGAVEYARKDAESTARLFGHQKKYPVDAGEITKQTYFDFALRLTSNRGLLVDQERVKIIRDRERNILDTELKTLIAEGIIIPSGTRKKSDKVTKTGKPCLGAKCKSDTKNTKAIEEEVRKHFPGNIPLTDSGRISTTEKTIEMCLTSTALQSLSRYRKAEKLLSNYIKTMMEAGDMPVHCHYSVLGAETGRTSCSSPNLQNQPRSGGIRECFIPRPGNVFVVCDYESQELRTLAQVCLTLFGKSKLAEKYIHNPDFDPHIDFAATLMGISYEEALERKANKDPLILEYRQRTKAANYGLPGGLWIPSFRIYSEGFGLFLSEKEAADIIAAWREQWPEMKRYFPEMKKKCGGGRDTTGVVDQIIAKRPRGNCKFTSGLNTLFQGLASDASKLALWWVQKAMLVGKGSPLYGLKASWFIHDEIGVEAPKNKAEEVKKELKRVMEGAMNSVCPDVPSRAKPFICERWEKD